MRNVLQLFGVQKLRTSPYHSQTDGQVERLNRTLNGMLTTYVNDDHNDWDLHLQLALFAYRTGVHCSSGVSPLKAVYGREAVSPLTLTGVPSAVARGVPGNYCDELEETLDKVHKHVASNIRQAQKRQKMVYDNATKVESTQLEAGDWVWLNSKAVSTKKSRKFHKEWTGPYVIIRRLGRVNYHIKRNRLKMSQGNREENAMVLPTGNTFLNEPLINHHEEEQSLQEVPPVGPGPRRSTRVRRQPDGYQDFTLAEVEIEDALL